MTRPSEAEVTEAMVEAFALAWDGQKRLEKNNHDRIRASLRAALSTPPLPSAEPRDLSGFCVGCGQEAGPHNTYGDAEGRHALNVYPNFSVCDSCLPSSDDTAPLTDEMEPEEAALRCWHNDFTNRCIPFEEIAEQLMRWTALRTTPPLPSAESVAGERTAEAAFLRAWEASGEANPWMFLRTYRTTPPAAAQDTGLDRAAERLALEAFKLTKRGVVSARSPLGDALLDYGTTRNGQSSPLGPYIDAARAAGGE